MNSVVPKDTDYSGKLVIREGILANCTVLKRAFDASRTETGLTETDMELKYGMDLFRKGLARGDFWHDRKDGLYYSRSSTRIKNQSYTETQKLESKSEVIQCGSIWAHRGSFQAYTYIYTYIFT